MTIIDRINLHLPLIKAEKIDTILLGRLECQAFIASFELIYQQKITIDDLIPLTYIYRGLQLVPVNSPSVFALARIITKEADETFRV